MFNVCMTPQSFRKALSEAIELACGNQREIAKESGVHAVTLTNWLHGHRNPAPRRAMMVARTLRERGQRLERAAQEVMRIAEDEERRQESPPGANADFETLELFQTDGGIE